MSQSFAAPAMAPGAPSAEQWGDWRWHMRHRVTTLDKLREWVRVSPQEEAAISGTAGKYRWSVTPYYASLMDPDDPLCPIRQQAVPAQGELLEFPDAEVDPVGDMFYRKTNRVVHKYPDRVVLLVTETCPVYCRHCTRKFHTTDVEGTYFRDNEGGGYEEDLRYIREHPEIRDVLLTGGDPLSYRDEKLEEIISGLRAIPSVEIIRIGSRFPVLLPQRVTDEFCEMLARHHPVWLNTHFNHPREITPEAAAAVDRLLRHGVPVGNQTVLLKGINDDVPTMRKLMTELLRIRVRPYYLYHCDNVTGVSHFMTSVEKGLEIMEGLQGHMTGFGVPQYVLTTRIGKIPISRPYHEAVEDGLALRNYRGQTMTMTGEHYRVSPPGE
ncbi:arginine 2,3-aminomutase [Actinosynnema pretiosum subsp. pretiosum]|uniref:Lysine 2,3-aminomutase YodO family protein n=2 Tax=Actinosynnema TaxID=40566 RepID=C6WLD6_ACTMD|nr:arginine 2,3-aminomutase [Actinosynnema mirum]ACU38329.1 lysine 2,3-aminomutase YodO family protein [Actinosynnema mirum DSM 43827]QUF04161.1 arginine 2,3-aminomutase [Actinosynnema pretiosum subsp. pretiosum]